MKPNTNIYSLTLPEVRTPELPLCTAKSHAVPGAPALGGRVLGARDQGCGQRLRLHVACVDPRRRLHSLLITVL